MPTRQEGGTRPSEFWYCDEVLNANADPRTPKDPDFRPYSSVVTSAEPDSDIEWDTRIGAGNIDPQGKAKMPEDHSLTVTYELERFPVANDGSTVDPFGDVGIRTKDNELVNTHSYLEVQRQMTIVPANTLHARLITNGMYTHPTGSDPGARPLASRSYLYGYGGRGEEAALSVDPSDSGVCTVEMPYSFEKLRPYQIEQPEQSTKIALQSLDPDDGNVEVTVESVDAQQAEKVTLNSSDSTQIVTTSTSFDSVRCVDVRQQPHNGAIMAYTVDGSGNPDHLLTIVPGAEQYNDLVGDSGVPAINNGSFGDGSSLGRPQWSLGTGIEWNGGRAGDQISSTSITVSNEIESTETQASMTMAKSVDGRSVTAESTVFGQTERHQKLSNRLQGDEGEMIVHLLDGDIVFPRAYISDGGMASREEEQAQMSIDVTFTAMEGPNGEPAIVMQRDAAGDRNDIASANPVTGGGGGGGGAGGGGGGGGGGGQGSKP